MKYLDDRRQVSVRPATGGDAEAIAALQVRAWYAAYGSFVRHDKIAKEAVEEPAFWAKHLGSRPPISARVATVGGRIVGFSWPRAAPDLDLRRGKIGQLNRLYVDPAFQGKGYGGLLLADAESWLERWGFREAKLWVFAQNEHARTFYERAGWQLEYPQPANSPIDWAPLLRYGKRLVPPLTA